MSMRRVRFGLHGPGIAETAAAIFERVAVEALAIEPRQRHADAIAMARYGREVADDHRELMGIARAAEIGERALIGIARIDPLEPLGLGVELIERGELAVEAVEIAHHELNAAMKGIPEQVPIEAVVVVPFARLREFAAHEQKLLAGMRPHEAVIGAQIGEALPAIARHLAQERAFAMDDLVMAQRQDEILVEG